MRTFENIWKIATGRRDDCPTGFLLNYLYFKKYSKMIKIDLIKQQVLDAHPKAILKMEIDEEIQQCI